LFGPVARLLVWVYAMRERRGGRGPQHAAPAAAS